MYIAISPTGHTSASGRSLEELCDRLKADAKDGKYEIFRKVGEALRVPEILVLEGTRNG